MTGEPSTSSSPPDRAFGAREDVEQLVLALALERDHAEHLARVEVERDILQLVPRGEASRGDAGLHVGRPSRRGRSLGDRGHVLDDVAEHELDDPLLGALGHVDDADGLALAQDGRAVADGGDLDHPVGDEDDRAIAASLAADHLEDALGEVRGQGRGHLVEHQHVGLDRHRAGEVDDPERGQRHAPRHARQVQVVEAQLVEPVAEGLDRRLGQPEVGPDVQVRDQRRLLVDRHEAAAARLGRRMGGELPAADGDRPGVRADGAGQDLDERALAGAVGAHERMDFAGAHRQRGGLQRDDRAVGLRDARGLEQEVRGGEGHRSLDSSTGDAGRIRHLPLRGSMARGRLFARALAGDGLLGGVRGVALDLETERPERVETVDLPRLEQRLALVRDVVRDDRVQEDRVRRAGAGAVSTVSPLRSLSARPMPAPPTAAVLVTAAPVEARDSRSGS